MKHDEGQRNFHIFYQLVKGADVNLLKNLKLHRNLDSYEILKDPCHTDLIESFDDKDKFSDTRTSLAIIGFTAEEIICIFCIIASVLKLGNIQFLPRANIDGTEGCSLINEYELYDVCELLLLNNDLLETALTQRTVEMRHEILVTDLSAHEASFARDCLCKALYNRLFIWLINRMNDILKPKISSKKRIIGILDMYGFEVFEKNRFEQFLINYCNEKLHQIYVDKVLREEQEEYKREGISWKKIDFFNNFIICDLIETNNHGILSILDEECLRPSPTGDIAFLHRISQNCHENLYVDSNEPSGCKNYHSHPHCSTAAPSLASSSIDLAHSSCGNPLSSLLITLADSSFRVRHFATSVTYSVNGFVEKNRDLLSKDLSFVMFNTEIPLLRSLFPEGNPKRTNLKRPATTSAQFKISMCALLKNIHSKHLNFVKCIRPNTRRTANTFQPDLVANQIRYHLLLESAKLVRNGYFYRLDYGSFLNRYKMLSPLTWPMWTGPSCLDGVNNLLKDLPLYMPSYAFGRTKIFIKHPRTMFELEELRKARLHQLVSRLQIAWRAWAQRKRFLAMRKGQRIIAQNYRTWKRYHYFMWLSRRLPSMSPICRDWPPCPASMTVTSNLLRKCYHRWRCYKYRQKFDQTSRNRMREKVTASILFKGKKMSYLKSVSHPFRGDYVKLRQNIKWKRIASETGHHYVVFADIVNKITRNSGKCVQKLLVISTCAMIVMDQRTLQVKYSIPVKDIIRISLSPYNDDLVVIHVRCPEASKRRGAFVFESCHVIEIVTKLFLVIQNVTNTSPEIQIASEFEANFGKENIVVFFNRSGQDQQGPAKIVRKTARMEVIL
ncbi:myosin 95E [Brevipalpus obovatus]|uniref:myosin 95E n=1 Tax=Brevipalpus obovatus TaxID=246614 RepID=UPI003D9F7CE3